MAQRLTLLERVHFLLASIPAGRVARCLRTLSEAGLAVTARELAAHHLAGGAMENVTEGVVEARRLGVDLPWMRACAIDLATKYGPVGPVRLVDVVRTAHEPRGMILPTSGGFECGAPGKFTWRTRVRLQTLAALERYVGGGDVAVLEVNVNAELQIAYADARDPAEAARRFATRDPARLGQGTRFAVRAVELIG